MNYVVNLPRNCYFKPVTEPKGIVVLCKSQRCKNPVAKRGRICDACYLKLPGGRKSCKSCQAIIHVRQTECARHMLESKGGVTRRTRKSIPKAVRIKVYARDRYTCRQCGIKGKGRTHIEKIKGFEIDHKKPNAAGGSTKISNLQVLCRSCNNSKRHYRIRIH